MTTKKMEASSSQGGTWRRQRTMGTCCTGRGFLVLYEEFIYSENNQSLEQPPQGCGEVLTTGGFQDVFGKGAR